MANNRMFITHRPSGTSVYVAKRMGAEWYVSNANLIPALDELFTKIYNEGGNVNGRDEFVITLEDIEYAGRSGIEIDYSPKSPCGLVMYVEEV